MICILNNKFFTSFQVVEFGWPDHHAPTMSTLICIVKTMDSWLKQVSHYRY